MPWKSLQPQLATHDWSLLDAALKISDQTGGVPMGLSVYCGTDEARASSFSPSWLWSAGAQKFTYSSASGVSGFMALPWDPIFQREWKAFISALGARYDGDPRLSYITLTGLGHGVETYVGGGDTARIERMFPIQVGGQTFKTAGSAWLWAAEQIIGYWLSSFPTTTIFTAFGKPFEDASGQDALRSIGDWVIGNSPSRAFGFQCNSLSYKSSDTYLPNYFISQYRAERPAGFQVVGKIGDPRLGNFKDALQRGVDLGGHWVELYSPDVADSANDRLISDFRAAFKANALPV